MLQSALHLSVILSDSMVYALDINMRIAISPSELNFIGIARISHERCNIRSTDAIINFQITSR